MSLLRAGVDMLRSCPAVSLKEKSPVQPPHPPAQRPNHCGSPPPPRLHKQPCNDVSLRRLQIPPPSASTTAGGGERGRGERARAPHRRGRRRPSGLVACGQLRRVRSALTMNTARPNAHGAYTLPCLAPPVASFKFGRTGREWCIRSLRFRGRGGGNDVRSRDRQRRCQQSTPEEGEGAKYLEPRVPVTPSEQVT